MPSAKGSGGRAPMSDAHKAALARGRQEGRAVRRYLEALESQRPRRGRKRTPESIKRRLAAVHERLDGADALSRLHLLQEKADLEAELTRAAAHSELSTLEKGFVKVARAYGQRKGIGYQAWRSAGVSAAVLQRAGIPRGPAPAPPARGGGGR
ncbi:MAG TPA: hypothetical protein VMB72_07525 [Acidimicrobiales bacterium]|nr:hypothetical protein [Acidimicrobiales bacterium]